MQIKLLPTIQINFIFNFIFIKDILILKLQLGGLISGQDY